MKLQQWTIFLDILGYGEENKNIKTQKEADKFIEFMLENKTMLIELNQDNKENKNPSDYFDINRYYEIKFVFISDSFVLSFVPKAFEPLDFEKHQSFTEQAYAKSLYDLTEKIQRLISFVLVKKGLFLRGGISNKFTDIKDFLAVGEGLIESYSIESKLAKYPRIILSKDIVTPNFRKNLESLAKFFENFSIIKQDSKGFFYLDHLGYRLAVYKKAFTSKEYKEIHIRNMKNGLVEFLISHKDIIQTQIIDFKDKCKNEQNIKLKRGYLKVLRKYQWSKHYHNCSIKQSEIQEFEKFLI